MRFNYKTVPAEKAFPLLGVFDGVVLGKKGTLSLGWELTLPVAYSLDETEYDDMVNSFASAVRLLPAWTVVHRQDLYTREEWHPEPGHPAAGSFLRSSYDAHFDGRSRLIHKSLLYLTFAGKNNVEKQGKGSGLFGINPVTEVPSPEDFGAFRAKCDEFKAVLTTGGRISMRELTEADWLGDGKAAGLVQQLMMLGDDSPVISHVAMSPDRVSVKDRTAFAFVIGESDVLPGEVSSVSKVDALSTTQSKVLLSTGSKLGLLLDCEHVVNQYFIVPSQTDILKDLDKERKKMFSGMKDTDNRINGEEIAYYLDEVYKNGLFTVKTHLNVIAWDSDSALQGTISKVSAAIKAMGVEGAVYNNYNTPLLWYAALPSCAFELGKENLMTAELRSAICLGSFETFEKSMPGGIFRICDRMTHTPVCIDAQKVAQDLGMVGNYNAFTLGGSGTGKSFVTNAYLRNCYDAGESEFIIDAGDSYQGLAEIIREESGGRDGHYLSWDKDHPFSFNPFLGWREWLSESGGLHTDDPGVNYFLSFLQTVFEPEGGWKTANKAILNQIVSEFISLVPSLLNGEREPILDDFFRWVDGTLADRIRYHAPETDRKGKARHKEDIEADEKAHGWWVGNVRITPDTFNVSDFILSMKEYAKGGSYEFLLNDPAPADLFTSRFTVFEVDRLSQDDRKFYSLCVLSIINAFERKMRSADGFKVMVIDEAWKAIANEQMGGYIASLYKTARKFNCSVMTISQEVADISKSPTVKTAILDNSDTKILLDQSNHLNTFDELSELLSLTEKDRNLVLSMNRSKDPRYLYREVFIKIGSQHANVYATEVSREEALAYESNKKKKAPLYELASTLGGSVIEAIKKTVSTR